MSGAPPRARRMVSLGKVTAPKPVNLPSQKKENNGNNPTINLVPKGTGTWGDNVIPTSAIETASRESLGDAPKLPPRAIPAAPTAAWGGAGLPEERKRALELASREEFPVLTAKDNIPERQRSRPPSEGRQAAWDDDERSYAGPPEDRDSQGHRGERWGEHSGYTDRDRYPPYMGDRERGYGLPDRDRYGPGSDWDRYDRGRQPPPDWERYGGPDERYHGYREGPGQYDRERYDRHGPSEERYTPPPPRGDRYGLPPPARDYGYPDEDYHGPPRRYHDGPPSRGDSDYEREQRRPYPDYDGPYRGPPRGDRHPPREFDYGHPGSDFYPRIPPPPPPPRRKGQTPEPGGSLSSTPPQHANGGPLERSTSLQSGSTQLSDSTAATSRRATLGSSMPRSDWGSVTGELQTAESVAERDRPAAPAQEPLRDEVKAEEQAGSQPSHQDRPDVRERPRARVPPPQPPSVQKQQTQQKSHMQTLGQATRKAGPAPSPAAVQPEPKQPSLSAEQPAISKPSEQQQQEQKRRDEEQQPSPSHSQQQQAPTKILKRETLSPISQQPAVLIAAPHVAAAAATSPVPNQQQIPQMQPQAVVRPPPPPPPRQQQQQQQQQQATIVPAANAQAAAEAAAQMAQINLAAPGAAAQPQQNVRDVRPSAWGQPQPPLKQQVQRAPVPSVSQQLLPQPSTVWQPGQAAAKTREQGSRAAEDVVQLGGGLSLPSQDSLMHHIASPERPSMRSLPSPAVSQQQPQQQNRDLGVIQRGMLPTSLSSMAPHPPVSVTAHFAPSQGQQQPQQQHAQFLQQLTIAGLSGQPGAPMIYTALPGTSSTTEQHQFSQPQQRVVYSAGGFLTPSQQIQGASGSMVSPVHPNLLGLAHQQHHHLLALQQQQQQGLRMQPGSLGAAAMPATSVPQPLMTFGSMPQVAQGSSGVRMPVAPAPAPQVAQPVLQFGNVVLPSTIEGSVDSEVTTEGQGLSPTHHELTAEQQHAFMKAKAAEKARLLQEQEARRKQEEERRHKQRSTDRPPQPPAPQLQQQHVHATAPPPPPPRAVAGSGRPGRGRSRGRGEGSVQMPQQQQQQNEAAVPLNPQAAIPVEQGTGRGEGTAGRGGRGGRGRGRGRGDGKAHPLGDDSAASSKPSQPPADVVEVQKLAPKQQSQKSRPERSASGSAPTPPPGLAPGDVSGKGEPAAVATASVVVVERKRGSGGKHGAGRVTPAPGLSRQADASQGSEMEVNGNGEALEHGPTVRGGRSNRISGSRGGRGSAVTDSAPSSSTSEAGEGSRQGSRNSGGFRGRGRGRGGSGGRSADKTAANKEAQSKEESARKP